MPVCFICLFRTSSARKVETVNRQKPSPLFFGGGLLYRVVNRASFCVF